MKRILLLLILLGFTVSLSSCVNISKFEDKYIEAGYTYSENSSYIVESLLLEFEYDEVDVSMYAFTKPGRVAIIVEFDKISDIEKSLDSNITLMNIISKFDSDSLIKKKFLIIPIATTEIGEQEIIDIFND